MSTCGDHSRGVVELQTRTCRLSLRRLYNVANLSSFTQKLTLATRHAELQPLGSIDCCMRPLTRIAFLSHLCCVDRVARPACTTHLRALVARVASTRVAICLTMYHVDHVAWLSGCGSPVLRGACACDT